MNKEQISVVIISSLISGVIGVVISIIYHRRYEKYRIKYDTLKKFCANRFDLRGDKFSEALNEIPLIFSDSREIVDEVKKLHIILTNKDGSANDCLFELYKKMNRDLRINTSNLDMPTFLNAFNIKEYK